MARWAAVAKRAMGDFYRDDMPLYAAALAFFTLLAIVPLFALGVVGAQTFLGSGEAARGALGAGAEALLEDNRADAVDALLADAAPSGGDWLTLVVILLFLAFATTRLYAALGAAFNRAWGVEAAPRQAPKRFAMKRLASLALILGLGILLLAGFGAGALVGNALPGRTLVWTIARLAVSFVAAAAVLALLYRYLPDAEVRARDAIAGASVTAVLFAFGERLLGVTLGSARLESVYGSLAGIIFAMTWFYYTSLIVLLGAEITHARALERGDGAPPEEIARPERTKREAA